MMPILINYNTVSKQVKIVCDELSWEKVMTDIENVIISPNGTHVTFSFKKKISSDVKNSIIILPDDKKIEYSFTTSYPYLYTEDQYEIKENVIS
jgi:hypothetical protein